MIRPLFSVLILFISVQLSYQKDKTTNFEHHCIYKGDVKPPSSRQIPHPMHPKPQLKLFLFADIFLLNKTFNGDRQEMEYYVSDVVEGARKLIDGLGLDLYWFHFEVGTIINNYRPPTDFSNYLPDFGNRAYNTYRFNSSTKYDIAIHLSGKSKSGDHLFQL